MGESQDIPPPAREALDIWLRHHDQRVPGFVEGLYLVGSISLGNWRAGSDVDIVAVSAESATPEQVEALRAAHQATVADVADADIGMDTDIDIDGPFVTWAELASPPAATVRPWTLHRQFHHDDQCFECNPAIWQTLASHGVTVRGAGPADLDIHVDDDELRSFVRDNTASYWRSIPSAIDAALADQDRTEFDAAITSWSVLGIGRMLYTARTGKITSKSDAGHWLIDQLPHHGELIAHAIRVRETGQAPPDDRATAQATATLVSEVADLVEAATA